MPRQPANTSPLAANTCKMTTDFIISRLQIHFTDTTNSGTQNKRGRSTPAMGTLRAWKGKNQMSRAQFRAKSGLPFVTNEIGEMEESWEIAASGKIQMQLNWRREVKTGLDCRFVPGLPAWVANWTRISPGSMAFCSHADSRRKPAASRTAAAVFARAGMAFPPAQSCK